MKFGLLCGVLSRHRQPRSFNIYGGEVVGTETQWNLRHVTGARDLLAGVGADNRAATLKAVQRIVCHGVWHIVRLRARWVSAAMARSVAWASAACAAAIT
jgi:hypothetical protein